MPEYKQVGRIQKLIAGANITLDPVSGEGGDVTISAAGSSGAAWGSVTGTLSAQTDLQTALNGKAPTLGADDNYVTDAQLVVIGNTSGTNSGNQTSIVGITGTVAQFNTAITDGDLATGGGTATGTNTGDNTNFAPPLGVDDNYATDAEKVKLANLSNTNTGDQDLSTLAPKASPTFTGTVSGITKTMVGLGSVDNTADTAKPVSTAQQTALDAKLDDTQFSGLSKITVNTVAPSTPSVGDLWCDTN